jgi:hypothetical protein
VRPEGSLPVRRAVEEVDDVGHQSIPPSGRCT